MLSVTLFVLQSFFEIFRFCLGHISATANTDMESLQDELLKKNDQNLKQQDEIFSLSQELREIHRRLNELKRENEELKVLLTITGKTRHEYETKVCHPVEIKFRFIDFYCSSRLKI